MKPLFEINFSYDESQVIIFSILLGKNARKCFQRIREISSYVETFDLDDKENLLENLKFHDAGIIKISSLEDIQSFVQKIQNDKKFSLMLNRCHLPTYFSLLALKPEKVIVFDAHADLYQNYEFEDKKIKDLNLHARIKFSPFLNDATWLRRWLEKTERYRDVFLLGVRACSEDEFEFMEEKGIEFASSQEILSNPKKVAKRVKKFSKNSRVYLSLDIDVFDPCFVSVEHPEVSGIRFSDFDFILKNLGGRIIGADVCCFKEDKAEKTEFLVSRAAMKILGKMRF